MPTKIHIHFHDFPRTFIKYYKWLHDSSPIESDNFMGLFCLGEDDEASDVSPGPRRKEKRRYFAVVGIIKDRKEINSGSSMLDDG